MSNKPFEIFRWESPNAPTVEMLTRMLGRDNLTPESVELAAQIHTPEMKFEKTTVNVLASGQVQYSFPGYGVIELESGDVLEIQPGVLHDIIVGGSHSAVLLRAFK